MDNDQYSKLLDTLTIEGNVPEIPSLQRYSMVQLSEMAEAVRLQDTQLMERIRGTVIALSLLFAEAKKAKERLHQRQQVHGQTLP